jgi:hypothetical protein
MFHPLLILLLMDMRFALLILLEHTQNKAFHYASWVRLPLERQQAFRSVTVQRFAL